MQISHVVLKYEWDCGALASALYLCSFWNVAVHVIPLTIDKYVRRMMFGDTNDVSSTYCDPLGQLLLDSAILHIGARWIPWETNCRPWARGTVGACQFGGRPTVRYPWPAACLYDWWTIDTMYEGDRIIRSWWGGLETFGEVGGLQRLVWSIRIRLHRALKWRYVARCSVLFYDSSLDFILFEYDIIFMNH